MSVKVYSMLLDDWIGNFAVDVPKILAANVRVLVYSGDKDFICNYIGGQRWVANMDWPGKVCLSRLISALLLTYCDRVGCLQQGP